MSLRFIIAISALAIAACSDPTPPPEPSMPTPRPKPKAAEETEELTIEDEYVFSPIGKRDPFRSYLDRIVPQETIAPDPLCGPLCNWELGQLRLAAVVSGMASPLAMVEDPQGNGYNVRRGTSIGKRSGKVTEILRDRLIVTEYRRLGTGEVVSVETEIPLRGSGRDAAEDAPQNLLVTQDGESIPE